jgi:hypothetical protein
MHPIRNITAKVLTNAVGLADRHAPPAAVASALLGALSTLRGLVGEGAGYTQQTSLDDFLANIVIAHGLDYCRSHGHAPIAASLPKGPSDPAAAAILDDAVQTCLQLNSVDPDSGSVAMLASGLLEQLAARIGGLPGAADLLQRLRHGEVPPDEDPQTRQIFRLQ